MKGRRCRGNPRRLARRCVGVLFSIRGSVTGRIVMALTAQPQGGRSLTSIAFVTLAAHMTIPEPE